MKLTILTVGKLKDAPWRELEGHYLKLLSRYGPCEVLEVRDAKLGAKRLSGAEREKAVAAEAENLLARVPETARLIALDERGREMSSQEMAAWLEERTHEGRDLIFALGGPLGHAPAVRERADDTLALGRITLPHQMARVVLLEQLYRCWTIIRGETYHY
ncbi:MAG: 23S rRNA (pseudouridine(1915)-N(3))-methyltransferase RlmH [Chrysiogenetes bacterium]|nr:23S rRNA (pseudouridine(1915)-N(3))-methyltransferase RlmH [Chrysiogenetes bacterium]